MTRRHRRATTLSEIGEMLSIPYHISCGTSHLSVVNFQDAVCMFLYFECFYLGKSFLYDSRQANEKRTLKKCRRPVYHYCRLQVLRKTQHDEEVQPGSYHVIHFRLVWHRPLDNQYVLAKDKPPHITVGVL